MKEPIYYDERPGAVTLKHGPKRPVRESNTTQDLGVLLVVVGLLAFAFWLGIKLGATC